MVLLGLCIELFCTGRCIVGEKQSIIACFVLWFAVTSCSELDTSEASTGPIIMGVISRSSGAEFAYFCGHYGGDCQKAGSNT